MSLIREGPVVDPFATGLFRNATDRQKQLMLLESAVSLQSAAETVFYAATNEGLQQNSGSYLFNSAVVDLEEKSSEREDAKLLWEICESIDCCKIDVSNVKM